MVLKPTDDPARWPGLVNRSRVYPCAALLMLLCSTGLAQGGKGPSHIMIGRDSVKWEAPPAGMFRGGPPIDTTSVWRYARLEGDPLKPGGTLPSHVRVLRRGQGRASLASERRT